MLSLLLAIFPLYAHAGDLQHVCNVIANHHEWECEDVQNADMKLFCNANIDDTGFGHDCNRIASADLAHLCHAVAEVQPHECEAIVAGDMKKTCAALGQGQREACATVKDANWRAFCDATALQKGEECAGIRD